MRRRSATKSTLAPSASADPATAPAGLAGGIVAFLLVASVVMAFWPLAQAGYINYDDDNYVSNPQIQKGLTAEGVAWVFTHAVNSSWAPVALLSHMLDRTLFGSAACGSHLTSVLVHGANTLLLFFWLWQLTGQMWRSAMVAALFGLHPLHVESVAWIAERRDVLSVFFGILSLVCYCRYATSMAARRRAVWAYALALLFLALGLMSKGTLVTWPCVMLLLDYWPLKRVNLAATWRLLAEKIPFFALAAVGSLATFYVQRDTGSLAEGEGLPLAVRVATALISYCRYLGKIFWPVNLAVYYPHPGQWPLGQTLLAGLALAVLTALAVAARRKHPAVLMGWLWFLGAMTPMIQLIQAGVHSIADRYTYVPLIGLFIAFTWAACEGTRNWRLRMPVLFLAAVTTIAACAVLTWRQANYWRDSETLFRHALASTESMRGNCINHFHLGMALDSAGRGDEAIEQYRQAVALNPDYADAYYNLGTGLFNRGLLDEAIPILQTAIRLQPDLAMAHNTLGVALAKTGRADAASAEFVEAIRLNPDVPEPHHNYGAMLYMNGRIDEAIGQYAAELKLNPNSAPAHAKLGDSLARKGRLDEAIAEYREAIRLAPDFAAARRSLELALRLRDGAR